MSQTGHEITLTEAKELIISGVENVQSATATAISATTTCGGMVIKGKNIHVEKLDLEQKVLIATGEFEDIKYVSEKKPFLKRVFK